MKKLIVMILVAATSFLIGCAGGDDVEGNEDVRNPGTANTPDGVEEDGDVYSDEEDSDQVDDDAPSLNNDMVDPNEPVDPEEPVEPEEPKPEEPYEGWVKTFGSAGVDWPRAVTSTPEGNVIVAGSFESDFAIDGTPISKQYGSSDAFVIAFDSAGELLWHVVYGSNGADEPHGLAADADGNVYVVGDHAGNDTTFNVGSDIHQGLGGRDAHAIKLDSDGNRVWVRTMGDERDDTAYAVDVHSGGEVAITGRYNHKFEAGLELIQSPTAGYGNDVFVASLDAATGAVSWAKGMVGFGSDIGTTVAVDETGGIVVGLSLQYDLDVGTGMPLNASASFENAIVAFDSLGNSIWAKRLASTDGIAISELTLDALGRVYATGSFKGTLDLGPVSYTSDGLFDVWIASYETDGSFAWAQQLTGSSIDQAMGLTLNGRTLYVTGRFTEGLSVEGKTVTSVGGYDGFLASFDALNGAVGDLTSFGSVENDQPEGIANADSRGVFISGYVTEAVQMAGQTYPAAGGGLDSFVIKAGH